MLLTNGCRCTKFRQASIMLVSNAKVMVIRGYAMCRLVEICCKTSTKTCVINEHPPTYILTYPLTYTIRLANMAPIDHTHPLKILMLHGRQTPPRHAQVAKTANAHQHASHNPAKSSTRRLERSRRLSSKRFQALSLSILLLRLS
jgi:hypothetical protein